MGLTLYTFCVIPLRMMTTWCEVIALWPSVEEMAQDLSVPSSRVRGWGAPGRGIPGWYFDAIVAKARQRGFALSHGDLCRIAAARIGQSKRRSIRDPEEGHQRC